ncbi:MAG: hypothetical protein HZA12_05070 [Nitrospirae bacterium]|nr:hypothetical protein [Nitrospirota bacterium]
MVKKFSLFFYRAIFILAIIPFTGCAYEYSVIGPGLEGDANLTGGRMAHIAGMPGGSGTSDGTGIYARFGYPKGIAAYGNILYVADKDNHTLREIDIGTKAIRTVAGMPLSAGMSDGYGRSARFNSLEGVATDGEYTYIADTGNHVIRKMDAATGYVSTLAGLRGQPGSNDSSDSTAARFRGPTGMTLIGDFLYVADTQNSTIRRVNKNSGETVTVAGVAGEIGYTDGPAINATFSLPTGIDTDGANIFIADTFNHAIRMLDLTDMRVYTAAGGESGYADGGWGVARFTYPSGIAIKGPELYVADYGNCVIRVIDLDTMIVNTLSGMANYCGSTDGPLGTGLFNGPEWLVAVGDYLYVSDSLNLDIRRVDIGTGEVITFAGLPPNPGYQNGVGEDAQFYTPGGVAIKGNILYVADTYNHVIRKLEAGTVSVYAGGPGRPGSTDSDESPAFFNNPVDIVVSDRGDYLYITDRDNHVIRRMNLSSGEVRSFAGYPDSAGTEDGVGRAARFNAPSGAIRIGDSMYVADSLNHTIRRVGLNDGAVTTLAGRAGVAGTADSTDGTGLSARLREPRDIATDGNYLYVADSGNHAIRRIDAVTGVVTTVAGSLGQAGLMDSDKGLPQFNLPSGIVWYNNSLYVADTGNHLIRRIDLTNRDVSTLAGDQECIKEVETEATTEQTDTSTSTNQATSTSAQSSLAAAAIIEKYVCTAYPAGTSKYSGDSTDGTGKTTSFNSPSGVNSDGAHLYVIESGNGRVRRVSFDTGETVSVSVRPKKGSGFSSPAGGDIIGKLFYIADSGNHTIRALDISDIKNAPLKTIAGNIGVSGYGYSSGYEARFNSPIGIAVDSAGNVYVADTANHIIRKIDAGTGEVSTIAGIPLQSGYMNSEFGAPRFNFPRGICVDEKNLYVADTGNHVIRRINLATGYVGLVAGLGDIRTEAGTPGTGDSTGAAAGFDGPRGIAMDETYLYVTDTGNHTIRRILKTTGQVKTLAGMPQESGDRDGVGFAARFYAPRGIVADGDYLYVADTGNNVIRRVNKYTGEVVTFSGMTGQSSFVAGGREDARYGMITGITTSQDTPYLFLTDSSENVILKVEKQ